MRTIIVTSFGRTWQILPEILAFVNYPKIKIFQNNRQINNFHKILESQNIETINQFWIICNNDATTNNAIQNFENWKHEYIKIYGNEGIPEIKYIKSDFQDLTSQEECDAMTDLIYRTILKAKEDSDKLLISLTGGRKTMSADLLNAASIWGCNLLFHININQNITIQKNELLSPLDHEKANFIFPVLVKSNLLSNYITEIPNKILSKDYPIHFGTPNPSSTNLLKVINKRLDEAKYTHYNAYKIRQSNNSQSNFLGLHQLHPSILNALTVQSPTKEWIAILPKAELHIHFGGVLNTHQLIEVAKTHSDDIEQLKNESSSFNDWILQIQNAISIKNDDYLKKFIQDKKLLRDHLNLPKPLAVAAFISCFDKNADYLDQLIFGNYTNNTHYRNIGIEKYEKLGDLQGSAILQSKKTIEKTCDFLIDYCKNNNIIYLELRCSPHNYTQGNLTEKEVINIIINKLKSQKHTDFRLIIIGSRHNDETIFSKHVELTGNLINDAHYKEYIIGFDIAGNESLKSPGELRPKLLPLLKECIRFTIHAGEDQPVDNIWQAVYELSADRIGHGLTLINNPQLMKRFKDKNISIELCPSSNFQICDFNSKKYPLMDYLNYGLKVTINTDNPGISRTTLNNEFLFAAQIAQLNKNHILQLIYNSFKSAFLEKEEKKKLLLKAEEKIFNILSNE